VLSLFLVPVIFLLLAKRAEQAPAAAPEAAGALHTT
jgi:hypothetical protein